MSFFMFFKDLTYGFSTGLLHPHRLVFFKPFLYIGQESNYTLAV